MTNGNTSYSPRAPLPLVSATRRITGHPENAFVENSISKTSATVTLASRVSLDFIRGFLHSNLLAICVGIISSTCKKIQLQGFASPALWGRRSSIRFANRAKKKDVVLPRKCRHLIYKGQCQIKELNLNSEVGARQSSGKLLMLNQCTCVWKVLQWLTRLVRRFR